MTEDDDGLADPELAQPSAPALSERDACRLRDVRRRWSAHDPHALNLAGYDAGAKRASRTFDARARPRDAVWGPGG